MLVKGPTRGINLHMFINYCLHDTLGFGPSNFNNKPWHFMIKTVFLCIHIQITKIGLIFIIGILIPGRCRHILIALKFSLCN